MNKTSLIETVAKETGVTKSDTKLMVNAITSAIVAELLDGNKVILPELGTFYISSPTVDEKRYVRFRPADDLKRKIKAR